MQALKLENLELNVQNFEISNTLKNHLTLCINDRFGRVIYANDNYCKLVGASRKVIHGEENEILKSRLHTNKVYKDLWKTISDGNNWEGILFYKISESRHYWLQTTVYPVKDKSGRIAKYFSIYNDITDYYQKQTPEPTVELGNEMVLRKIEDMILSVNERAKIIRAQNLLLNKDYDDVVGSYIYDFVREECHESVRSKIKEVFKENRPSRLQFSSCQEALSEELYISEVQPVIDKIGEVSHVTITTELKTKDIKVLRELNEIQTKYNSVLKLFSQGIIVVTNSKGIIREWNVGAERVFGFTEKEIVGRPITTLISKRFLDEGIKELSKIKESNGYEMSETIEMIGVRKDGSEFPVEIAINDWFCEKERYFSAIMLNVTKRKNLENRLRQKTKDLELLLYRSAHDLKAPLTSAEGLIELIKDENIDRSTSHLVELLGKTLEKGKLLFDNLAFASTISQKKLNVCVINFKKEIQNTLESLRGLDGFGDISFVIDVKQNKRFYSSKELLNSVFQNLIQNAINYRKPSSVSYKPEIKIVIEQHSNTVDIVISDNGLGINKENHDKVFDLYYRVKNEGTQGTGLGLYIVKCIIEDLNGTIRLDSEVAIGSTFKISIPNLSKKQIV